MASLRRLVIAATVEEGSRYRSLFAIEPLDRWDIVLADSVAQVRFLTQHEPCDAIVLDEGLYRSEGGEGLDWLAGQHDTTVLLLSGPEVATEALGRGAGQWLPREQALQHPPLLAAALAQAAGVAELRRSLRRSGELLAECRKQIGRLVNLLWEAAPHGARSPWLTQRHILERLQDEVARAERKGAPFAVVLGELGPRPQAPPPDPEQLAAWAAEQVTRYKRRADVAGRYGPNGFLMILVQTPEQNAALGCRRLQEALEADAAPGPVLAYFGIASYSPSVNTPKSLLSFAERRLEQAKHGAERIVYN